MVTGKKKRTGDKRTANIRTEKTVPTDINYPEVGYFLQK